jgi:hypothetical protein
MDEIYTDSRQRGKSDYGNATQPGHRDGMGAVAAAVAEFEAELRLQSQGIRMRSIEYTCGAAQAPKAMTVCVPKEMPPAEIEQKINAET